VAYGDGEGRWALRLEFDVDRLERITVRHLPSGGP
jgi:hypothetical protein